MCSEDKKFVSVDSADKNFEPEPQSPSHGAKPEKRATGNVVPGETVEVGS